MRWAANAWPAVYLCLSPVDFRKGMRSLAVLAESQLELDPFAESLFVFCNRQRTSIKILYWQRNGFCLWQKRLEQDRFYWPSRDDRAVMTLTGQQLDWLLEGYDIARLKPHKNVQYRSIL